MHTSSGQIEALNDVNNSFWQFHPPNSILIKFTQELNFFFLYRTREHVKTYMRTVAFVMTDQFYMETENEEFECEISW